MRRVSLLLCLLAAACGGSGNEPSFAMTVSSPNTNVLFGTTEQMAVSFSDGKVHPGTWSSSDIAIATVDPSTGIVTPVGAGQSVIVFTADGKTASKTIRDLPDLRGTFGGSYTISSCTQSEQFATQLNTCATFVTGTALQFTFFLTQSGDIVSGRFLLGTLEFENTSGTIALSGTLPFVARNTGSGALVINANWQLFAQRPQNLGGILTQTWTSSGLTGSMIVSGQITEVFKVPSVTAALVVVPRTLQEAVRSVMEK